MQCSALFGARRIFAEGTIEVAFKVVEKAVQKCAL